MLLRDRADTRPLDGGPAECNSRIAAGRIELERIVHFEPGYPKRDPDPSKNYGIHGMQLRFVLKGKQGATQFLLMTEWFPIAVQRERWHKGQGAHIFDVQPMAADLGYHSLVPQYEGQGVMDEACPVLDGRPCYYGGSGLAAEPVRDAFLAEGDAAVWRALEMQYKELFGSLE